MSETKEQTILDLMGLSSLSEDQQNEALEKFGNLVIEASIGQLVLTLSEEKIKEIEVYAENIKDGEDVFGYLLKTQPDFKSIVEKQIAALQEEIAMVYSTET